MRIPEICPTCVTYINAKCIIYDGDYLSNIDVSPMDPLDEILSNINTLLIPRSGAVAPTANASYIGQLYVNTSVPTLYYARSVGYGAGDWVPLINGVVPTTTTTTTTP